MSNENLKLWNKASVTDPKHTKKIEFGAGFKPTTIDAYQQIKNFTEEFGVATQGWHFESDIVPANDHICIVKLSLYTIDNQKPIQVFGTCPWMTKGKNSRLDEEAPKKATTDALTKAFSILGFNADVFMGYFDDNKYVAQAQQHHEAKAAQAQQQQQDNSKTEAMIQKIKEMDAQLASRDDFTHAPKSDESLRKMSYDQLVEYGRTTKQTLAELG